MDTPEDAGFLGRGWSFPTRFNGTQGEIQMVSREHDILESLWILFMTRPGERLMHPNFGCALHDLVFESMSPETEAAIELALSQAILFNEPRIDVIGIEVRMHEPFEGRMEITLDYRIRATNSRANVVFPFYLTEGTLVQAGPVGPDA